MRFSVMQLLTPLILLACGASFFSSASTASSFEARSLDASLPSAARVATILEDEGPQLEARLLVSSDPNRRVGVLFDLAPGWHLYWRNPGETGIAPTLGLAATRHHIGEVAWPTPQTFREADGLFTTYGYANRVLLSAPIEALEKDASKDVIRAQTSVLVCRTQCVPASFTLSTPLDPGLSTKQQSAVDALFRETNASVPVTATRLGFETKAHWTRGTPELDEAAGLELVVRPCRENEKACRASVLASDDALFIPMEGDTFEFSGARLVPSGPEDGVFTITIEATRLEDGEDRLRGLVMVRDATGLTQHVELDLPIHSSSAEATSPAPITLARWAQIFALALLGGLILNGMPCVLPVLAIKVVAVADMAEKDSNEVRLHGLAYTAGVLGSMALLSAVVIALRSAGHSVGWGFQFQEPLFVAAISALLVAFALNLFGVFEIEFGQGRLASVGREATGFQRSVFEGLLAVILATPCTAPFLGTAVGFAFATSGFGIAAIFLAIGFGLASPFLLVSFFPRLARFIPRSGPWMMKLRAGLGFSLLATVVWLLWVLGQTGGTHAVIGMTGNLLFLAFLLWGFGQLQPARSVWLGRACAVGIASLAFVSFNLIDFDRAGDHDAIGNESEIESNWRPYSARAVQEALDAGRPSFVVFTADWCITCQVNEQTVLNRRSVREAFREGGFVLFKADWTRRDEVIRKKLAQFGRAGVPLYLVYSPEAPDRPQVLSELLSQREVIASLAGPRFARGS